MCIYIYIYTAGHIIFVCMLGRRAFLHRCGLHTCATTTAAAQPDDVYMLGLMLPPPVLPRLSNRRVVFSWLFERLRSHVYIYTLTCETFGEWSLLISDLTKAAFQVLCCWNGAARFNGGSRKREKRKNKPCIFQTSA